MLVELVRAKTRDGVRLHGAFSAAAEQAVGANVDAAILVHGVGSNFYSSAMMESVAVALMEHGVATLRVNTRGHDGVNTVSTDEGGRLQGAAFEIVDDCRYDMEAWCELLADRGMKRIALVGHSLGAIKVLYAHAHQPHRLTTNVVAISPPRLSYEVLSKGPGTDDFQSSFADANRLVSQSQPNALFYSTFPFSLVLSAGTFVDKYGPQDRYNLLKVAPQVRGQLNFVFGQQELSEGNSAFDQLVQQLEAATWPFGRPGIDVISAANHFYVDCFSQLQNAIWQALQESAGKDA